MPSTLETKLFPTLVLKIPSNITSFSFATPTAACIPPERWKQANFRYFNPHIDITHRKSKVVLVGKEVYY